MTAFVFMWKHRDEYSIARMAKVLGVSESGYYRWLSRKPSKRAEEDLVLIEEIAEIFYASHRVFGSRKITSIMRSRGRLINHKRVERLMSEYCMKPRVCKQYNSFTEPGDGNIIKDNLLKRDFSVTGPDQKMVSDTTGIRTKEGCLYVVGILDLWSGWPRDQGTIQNWYPQHLGICADEAMDAMAVRGKMNLPSCGKELFPQGRKICLPYQENSA